MAIQADLKPMAEGSFLKTPFAHILVFLFDKKMSGTLEVRREPEEISIYFCDGMPAKVKTSVKDRGLGHVLVWLGLIKQADLDACNAGWAGETGLLGQRLIAEEAIDVENLMKGLQEQALLKLTDVFALSDADYAFYDKVNKLSGFGPDEVFPIHPFPVILAGVRAYGDILDFDAALAVVSEKWITLDADIDTIRLYRLKGQEKQVVSALFGETMRGEALLAGGAWDPKVARYVLYVLLITKNLAVSQTEPAPASAGQTGRPPMIFSSVPPDKVTLVDPAIIALKRQIIERAKKIATQSYYEMLDVVPDTSVEDVRRAFFKLAKLFHPDKLPPELRAETQYAIRYLYANLSEAHSVLIDPTRRGAYDVSRAKSAAGTRGASDEESAIRDALDAESLFQRALVYLNQKKFDQAYQAVSDARSLNSEEGEYLGLATHLEAMKRPAGAAYGDLVEKLREASEKCPKSERVTFFMAELLKKANRPNEARHYYERVLEINPHNIHAGRAIRLIDLDKRKQVEAKSSGILKRFFK